MIELGRRIRVSTSIRRANSLGSSRVHGHLLLAPSSTLTPSTSKPRPPTRRRRGPPPRRGECHAGEDTTPRINAAILTTNTHTSFPRLLTQRRVALRWVYEQGVCSVVKSSNKDRMRENLRIFDWELSEEEHHNIREIPQKRVDIY
ncbi:hypothetical protein Taro_037046 [Colocasia esculenta]|uniref:NADP-dependent oxidoreductase domain-containing protein n=1 Tax=Colocasia esculenta TaxID=4460 RepID=A0A843VZC1_COLES|nr:hypothetical protein [Colocasia esculenta]